MEQPESGAQRGLVLYREVSKKELKNPIASAWLSEYNVVPKGIPAILPMGESILCVGHSK
ncbi:MAG: hypothetical protein AB1566_14660 [Chloroflexota bacterium]